MTATATAVKERPIPFSGAMVRAILEDRKTQTRRVVNQARLKVVHAVYPDGSADTNCIFRHGDQRIHCPYGGVGDRLWVREAWAAKDIYDDDAPHLLPSTPECACLHYLADGPKRDYHGRTRPGMFMPRAFSRITLEITGVRVERLQEITEEEAKAEGVEPCEGHHGWKMYGGLEHGALNHYADPRDSFYSLWDSINGNREGCAWANNPFVWVIEIRRLQP